MHALEHQFRNVWSGILTTSSAVPPPVGAQASSNAQGKQRQDSHSTASNQGAREAVASSSQRTNSDVRSSSSHGTSQETMRERAKAVAARLMSQGFTEAQAIAYIKREYGKARANATDDGNPADDAAVNSDEDDDNDDDDENDDEDDEVDEEFETDTTRAVVASHVTSTSAGDTLYGPTSSVRYMTTANTSYSGPQPGPSTAVPRRPSTTSQPSSSRSQQLERRAQAEALSARYLRQGVPPQEADERIRARLRGQQES